MSHYKCGTRVADSNNKVISEASYEYYIGANAKNDEFTKRMIVIVDGDKTDTEYNDIGLPLMISRNGEETRFEYDRFGHVTRKDTSTTVTHLEYSPTVNKVTSVRVKEKASGDETVSRFEYDNKANLLTAVGDNGKTVRLTYDSQGRIATLTSGTDVISFSYNVNSKPVKIGLDGVGEITVTYNDNGKIEKVDSPSGRMVSLKVTETFQELLNIIRPAGVSLSF
jgi:YD repeat-containing protein